MPIKLCALCHMLIPPHCLFVTDPEKCALDSNLVHPLLMCTCPAKSFNAVVRLDTIDVQVSSQACVHASLAIECQGAYAICLPMSANCSDTDLHFSGRGRAQAARRCARVCVPMPCSIPTAPFVRVRRGSGHAVRHMSQSNHRRLALTTVCAQVARVLGHLGRRLREGVCSTRHRRHARSTSTRARILGSRPASQHPTRLPRGRPVGWGRIGVFNLFHPSRPQRVHARATAHTHTHTSTLNPQPSTRNPYTSIFLSSSSSKSMPMASPGHNSHNVHTSATKASGV